MQSLTKYSFQHPTQKFPTKIPEKKRYSNFIMGKPSRDNMTETPRNVKIFKTSTVLKDFKFCNRKTIPKNMTNT